MEKKQTRVSQHRVTVLSLYKFSKILYILLTLHRFRIANSVCSCVLQSVSIERLLLDIILLDRRFSENSYK